MKIRTRIPLCIGLAACIFLLDSLAAQRADAVFGTRRRTALVTAAVVHEKDTEAAKQKESQPDEAPKQEAATDTAPEAAKPAPSGDTLPVGTIVQTLPSGCTQETVGDVAYQKCGANYYRAAFQGSNLVYVTAKP